MVAMVSLHRISQDGDEPVRSFGARLEVRLDWRENSQELTSLARLYGVFTLPAIFFLSETCEGVSREEVSESSHASFRTGEISWQLESVKTTCLKSAEF